MKYLKMFLLLVVIVMVVRIAMRPTAQPTATASKTSVQQIAKEEEAELPPPIDPSIPMGIAHPNFVKKETVSETDEYTKTTRFDGPRCVMLRGDCVNTETKIKLAEFPDLVIKPHLVAIRENTTKLWLYAIHVDIDYLEDNDPKLGRTAYEKSSTDEFKYTRLDFKVDCHNGCSTKTWGSIYVTKDFLKKSQHTGIDMKITGKQGDATFIIPKGYVQGFLEALE